MILPQIWFTCRTVAGEVRRSGFALCFLFFFFLLIKHFYFVTSRAVQWGSRRRLAVRCYFVFFLQWRAQQWRMLWKWQKKKENERKESCKNVVYFDCMFRSSIESIRSFKKKKWSFRELFVSNPGEENVTTVRCEVPNLDIRALIKNRTDQAVIPGVDISIYF